MMRYGSFVLLSFATAVPLSAAVLHVPTEHETIQAAIDAANDGDTVEVAPGEYVVTEPIDFNKSHNEGGSPLKNITVRSEAGPEETVIRMAEAPADPDRASVVLFVAGESESSVLEGFTITGGQGMLRTVDDLEGIVGGGVFCTDGSSPYILDCHISYNAAQAGAGIACAFEAAPTIESCAISDNTAAAGLGGGVGCGWGAAPLLIDCVISRNRAAFGAGLDLVDSPAEIRQCTIENNVATDGQGGGIACLRADTTISHCRIVGNWAPRGGGILFNGSLGGTVSDCLIEGNVASDGQGGGICHYDAVSPVVTACTIIGNYTFGGEFGGQGSGVYCGSDSYPEFTNCIVAANLSREGGPRAGIQSYRSTPVFRNCTVADNDASAMGCNEATPVLKNCIVMNGFSCGSVSNGLEDGDPAFVEPGEFDFFQFVTIEIGDEMYEFPDFIIERPDYHLLSGSPAIDAGSPEGAPAADLDGTSRPCGDGVDIGAYEYCGIEPPEVFSRGDVNTDGSIDIADAVSLLGHLFGGDESPVCADAADANDDGALDIADTIAILGYLFGGDGPLPGPFELCGEDPSEDGLTCDLFLPCL